MQPLDDAIVGGSAVGRGEMPTMKALSNSTRRCVSVRPSASGSGGDRGAIGIGERAELDANVGQCRYLGGAQRRDFLRRQQLDFFRLHLLLQPEAFTAAAVEPRIDQEREIGGQQQEDDDAHSEGGLSTTSRSPVRYRAQAG